MNCRKASGALEVSGIRGNEMNEVDSKKIEEEIWRFVQELNYTWTTAKKPDDLSKFFHADIVVLAPHERLRIEGQTACISAWKRFVDSTNIISWREIDPKIQLYGEGKFAIVTYYYEISLETNSQTLTLSGRDMFSLIYEQERWWAVADQFSPYPQ
ncbi:MAG: DUF4440 domain-containing protein [bacterium]|nr:DUF4440 domain-containing protein [bacterium]